MRLLAHQIRREQRTLMRNNIRFSTIGDVSRLPSFAHQVVNETKTMTEKNTGLSLVFALSYGGQQEIAMAAKNLAEAVQRGELTPESITTDIFSTFLETVTLPAPDLVIRTSGEKRLSNFLLWASAYSEMYFIEKHWPDFTSDDFALALADFSKRTRRFGKILTAVPSAAAAP